MRRGLPEFGLSMCTAIFTLTLAAIPVPASAQTKLNCVVGPIPKKFGQSDWLIYSCDDSAAIVVVADKGNPAGPFYFILTPDHTSYHLYGEGNGDKHASDLAYAELAKLSETEILGLISQTKTVAPNSH